MICVDNSEASDQHSWSQQAVVRRNIIGQFLEKINKFMARSLHTAIRQSIPEKNDGRRCESPAAVCHFANKGKPTLQIRTSSIAQTGSNKACCCDCIPPRRLSVLAASMSWILHLLGRYLSCHVRVLMVVHVPSARHWRINNIVSIFYP